MLIPRALLCSGTLLLAASNISGQFVPGRGHNGTDPFSRAQLSNTSLGEFEFNDSVAPPSSASGGIVDKSELLIPSKAIKEFQRSMKAFDSGDFRSASEHLEKATKIAPDFVQAHNNLGSLYINLGEYDRAVSELQKTIDLNPNLGTPHHNLAMVLILLHRLPEAETAARRALDLEPQESSARFTLGRILVLQSHYTGEAVHLLTDASADLPEARLPLARALQNRGEISRAVAELRAYLQSPGVRKKDQVETWLARLTQPTRVRIETIPIAADTAKP